MTSAGDKLHFRCACGARISAPAESLGRSARCPHCQAAIRLENPEEARNAPTESTSTSPAPAAAEKIRIACHCGSTVSAPSSAAGKRIRCPRCQAVTVVPLPESTPAASEPEDMGDLLSGLARGEQLERPVPSAPANRGNRRQDEFGIAAPVDLPRDKPDAPPSGPAIPCPSCGREWPARSKICTDCGVNLKTGRSLLTTQDEQLDETYVRAETIIWWVSWLIWIGFCPIASEAFGTRRPWAVRGIAAFTTIVSAWYLVVFIWNPNPNPGLKNWMLWGGQSTASASAEIKEQLSAEGASESEIADALAEFDSQVGTFSPSQLITHMLLHNGLLHLLGNLIFLMVFGSRVNALIGNILTLPLYLLLGIFAAWAELAESAHGPPTPMLGASGAIMGLAGMYVVLFPAHKVHVAMWLRWPLIAGFHLSAAIKEIPGLWVVLFYIALDIFDTLRQAEDGVAHWAHIGGFGAGVFFAAALLVARLINARGADLFSFVLGRRAWALIGKPNDRRLSLP